jgi:hypothetical protein
VPSALLCAPCPHWGMRTREDSRCRDTPLSRLSVDTPEMNEAAELLCLLSGGDFKM